MMKSNLLMIESFLEKNCFQMIINHFWSNTLKEEFQRHFEIESIEKYLTSVSNIERKNISSLLKSITKIGNFWLTIIVLQIIKTTLTLFLMNSLIKFAKLSLEILK